MSKFFRIFTKVGILSFAILFGYIACRNEKAGDKNQDKTKNEQMENVLIVLTSHSELGDTGEKTGFWLEEFTTPYYYLIDNDIDVTIASPKGGQAPIDPRSELEKNQTPSTRRFYNDPQTQEKIAGTKRLDEINPDDFIAVFYPGGHGPLWDLAEDSTSIALIENFIKNQKPVAAVCHGPAVFKNTKNEDGSYTVKGKNVTGFSDSEEEAVGLKDKVPFLVEDMLIENGGKYTKSKDWTPHAEDEDLIITGQNPASSELVAELLLDKIRK